MTKLESIKKLNTILGWEQNKDTKEWGDSIVILAQLKKTIQWKNDKMHEHRNLTSIGTMNGSIVFLSRVKNRKNENILKKVKGLLDD